MTPAHSLAGGAGVPETMSLEEAARYLRLGRDATRELFDRGDLPGVSLNQKHIVFRRAALDAFLAKMEVLQATARQAGKDPTAANDGEKDKVKRRRTRRVDLSKYEDGSAESDQHD